MTQQIVKCAQACGQVFEGENADEDYNEHIATCPAWKERA